MARPAHDYARVDKHVPVTRRAETADPYSPVMILLSLIATLGILFYAQFLLKPSNRGDLLPYALVIVAEVILVTHALLSMWTILSGRKSPREFSFHESKRLLFDKKAIKAAGLTDSPELWPVLLDGRKIDVDVFITVYGEDLDKIRATATAAMAIKGKHRTWILDDGRSDDVQALAERLGCQYVRRLSSNGAKLRTSTTRCRSPKATSSASLTPTSCPNRTSWLRPSRSSSTATSPSYRRRRPTAT